MPNRADIEVTNVSQLGLWLLVGGREPVEVPVAQLLNVALPHPTHIYWPDLDIDLSVQSIDSLARFPLVSRTRPARALPRGRARRRRRCSGVTASA